MCFLHFSGFLSSYDLTCAMRLVQRCDGTNSHQSVGRPLTIKRSEDALKAWNLLKHFGKNGKVADIRLESLYADIVIAIDAECFFLCFFRSNVCLCLIFCESHWLCSRSWRNCIHGTACLLRRLETGTEPEMFNQDTESGCVKLM